MDKQEMSFEMGSRLKSLREEKHLSYQELADALLKNYEIKISKDSLRDYEICSNYRSKAKSLPNLGMRTEYLFVLADFYGVSTDWLLGISKVISPDADVRTVCNFTGLSEGISIYLLQNQGLAQESDFIGFAPISYFNRLFNPEQFHEFLITLCAFFCNINSIKEICNMAESEIADAKAKGDKESIDYCYDKWFREVQSAYKEYKYARFDTIDFFTRLLNSVEKREGVENSVNDLLNLCCNGSSQE